MKDYWNDPPDYPEPPECCGEIMECLEDGALVCNACGKRIEPAVEPDPSWEHVEEQEDLMDFCTVCGKRNANGCELCDECARNERCRHGNRFGECGACDHESDLAYDSIRERRWR